MIIMLIRKEKNGIWRNQLLKDLNVDIPEYISSKNKLNLGTG